MNHPLLRQSSQWAVVLRLALRNVLRQKTRTSLTVSAVALGVIGLILTGGFIRDTFLQLGEAIVRSQNGHLQIARTGFFTYGSRSPERFLIEDPGRVAKEVGLQPEVTQAMARLHFSGLLGNGRTNVPVICEGVEPDKETRLSTHLAMKAGRNLTAGDRHGLIAGEGVARTLGLKPGDTVVLVSSTAEGTMNSVDFELVGVFQSFSKEYDARAVKIPLAAAQELFGSRGANLLVVELAATRDTVQVAEALRAPLAAAGLELRTWNELSDFYDKTVRFYDRQFGVLRLIVMFMVLLTVVNSVNMSLFERVAEFGTMRALGDRGSRIFALVVTEGLVFGVMGAIVGVVLGIVLALLLSAVGIPMPPPPNSNLGYVAQIRLVPSVILEAAIVGIVATTLAAVLPALRVSRIPVVEALRSGY